ncbi:universal stress protein [Comamonas aquatica]|nr:universal stress protein [Comamonas aquatica]
METIIVYVDDADYAQLLLQTAVQAPQASQAHWVLVGCAPRITHRVSRFVSNRSRENWRNKWADRLFQDCVPVLHAHGAQVTTVLARGPLPELLQTLQAQYGAQSQVVDMRRPKLQTPDTAAPAVPSPLHKLAGTLAGIGALWTVLIGETLAA